MGTYAATFAMVGGTFAIVDCLAETVRGDSHVLILPCLHRHWDLDCKGTLPYAVLTVLNCT